MAFTKERCLGYAIVIAASLFYSGQIISAQVLGRTYPVFELQLMRFSGQAITSLILVIILKIDIFTLKLHTDAWIIFGGSTAYTWMVLSICLAPLYGPVGSLESVAITVFILLNVLCAILRKTATCAIVLAMFISCAGVACLTQPGFLFPATGSSNPQVKHLDPCPCSGLQGDSQTDRIPQCLIDGRDPYIGDVERVYEEHMIDNDNRWTQSLSEIENDETINDFASKTPHLPNNAPSYINATTNINEMDNTDNDKNQYSRNNTVDSDHVHMDNVTNATAPLSQENPVFTMGLSAESFGYLLMASCGITFFISVQVNANVLLPRYHFAMLTFWYGAIGAIYSLVFLFVYEPPRFVSGLICGTVLGVHILFAAFTFLLTNLSLVYITAEENAILNTIGVVILFIGQSTFLVDFHPPKGNIAEVIGAILIVLACLFEPVITIVRDKLKSRCESKWRKDYLNFENEFDVNEKTFLLISRYPTETGKKYSVG